MKTAVAIYPGSFDPVTNGHLDLIERGEKMFDRLIVAVLKNVEKEPLFSLAERLEMLREATQQWDTVEVDVFEGLLVDYARKRRAGVILRGIRAISDYEYELQMALMTTAVCDTWIRLMRLVSSTSSPQSRLAGTIVQFSGNRRKIQLGTGVRQSGPRTAPGGAFMHSGKFQAEAVFHGWRN